MVTKRGNIVSIGLISVLLLAGGFLFVLQGCSNGGGHQDAASPTNGNGNPAPTVDESIGPNGVRKDIEAYINSAYPNSAKKRAALLSYAKAVQTAYSTVSNETEAMNMEPKIINALACVAILGEDQGKNSPSKIVDSKTTNTPERLAAELEYESFLDGKVFEMPHLSSAPETVCDFDPNSLPN